jgi:hypothetical protein
MRAIEAKTFSGYGGLQQIELAKPQPANSSRWGIELGIFIAAIQGSETLPLALRID